MKAKHLNTNSLFRPAPRSAHHVMDEQNARVCCQMNFASSISSKELSVLFWINKNIAPRVDGGKAKQKSSGKSIFVVNCFLPCCFVNLHTLEMFCN